MTFEVNEYVWDRVWRGPGVVIAVGNEETPYKVAEITQNAGHSRLGRVAERTPGQLCYYAKAVMPEDEIILLLSLLTRANIRPAELDTAAEAYGRLKQVAEKRGIPWTL